jgi:hypothetical protein
MADEATGEQAIRSATAEERRVGLDCLRCGMVVRRDGIWTLRTGGSSGGVTALFGGFAELGEGTIDVEVTTCPSCGHLEFRAPRRA